MTLAIALVRPAGGLAQEKDKGSAAPDQQPDQPPQYVYEVRGTSTSALDQDRSWSPFYDTEAAASSRLKEIEREYSKGGINELSKDKPLRLRVEKLARAAADRARTVKEAKDAVDSAEKSAEKATARKFVVWVFKWDGGEWIKQVDRTLNTDKEEQARKYVADVNAVSGWTATSNLAAKKKALNPAESLAGTSWLRQDGSGYKFEDGGRALKINPDGKGAYKGRMTWRLDGHKIEVQIAGIVDFGTIDGDTMTLVGFHIMGDANTKQKTEHYSPDVFRRASK